MDGLNMSAGKVAAVVLGVGTVLVLQGDNWFPIWIFIYIYINHVLYVFRLLIGLQCVSVNIFTPAFFPITGLEVNSWSVGPQGDSVGVKVV